ncbi:MAG: hypothetical protein AMJ81_10850 [Phycisphaerae bacterium SM23_33]|jgi:large subunit ribosomal protein L9|nr:MAG: hypothetical protein AMJ81_10850 [Phycisphaerae bacterium SM23_33]
MKVLLRRNVQKLGRIGDVVDVRPGYARNYLIPQGLALAPSEANIQALEAEKQAYLAELARQRAELETQARLLEGKEFSITARANEEGQLYGSVGPAQIAAAMAKEGIMIDADNIELDEPIRRLDKYEVAVRFLEEVKATIYVWVIPPREEESGAEPPAEPQEGAAGEQEEPPPGDSAESQEQS